jgi:hypothetical protein
MSIIFVFAIIYGLRLYIYNFFLWLFVFAILGGIFSEFSKGNRRVRRHAARFHAPSVCIARVFCHPPTSPRLQHGRW